MVGAVPWVRNAKVWALEALWSDLNKRSFWLQRTCQSAGYSELFKLSHDRQKFNELSSARIPRLAREAAAANKKEHSEVGAHPSRAHFSFFDLIPLSTL